MKNSFYNNLIIYISLERVFRIKYNIILKHKNKEQNLSNYIFT